MKMKRCLQFNILVILLLATTSSYAAKEQAKEKSTPSEPNETNTLQRLQGQWLCKKTFRGLGGSKRFEVNIVEYNRIQGNEVFSQNNDYIKVTWMQGNKRLVGHAIVLERGQEHIERISNGMYSSRLTRLDEASWITVDNNKVGQFIHDNYFPFLDKLAKQELAEGTLRITHIDELTTQRWRYHDDAGIPTYADCYRLEDTLLLSSGL